ncbi:hypothetical protein B7463_g3125, partial [Scytalidium lignicola]
MIQTRSLGRNGPQVPAIGFGAMSIGGIYGQQETSENKLKVLDRAHEIGERFWDTADIYLDSEDLIGEWFKQSGKRSDIFLATKFGVDFSTGAQRVFSDPEYIRSACARSLQSQGKIRYLGLSEVSASTIRRAHAIHPISAVQIEYSPFCLDIESPKLDILRTCRELGITVVAYSPIGRGMLTGQIKCLEDLPEDDFRRLTPKYSNENFPKVLNLVEQFRNVSRNHQCSIAQAALAWVIAQGDDIIPIPGTRSIKYLEENTKAMNVNLTTKEVKQLRRCAEETELIGDRYPTTMMGPILGDTPPLYSSSREAVVLRSLLQKAWSSCAVVLDTILPKLVEDSEDSEDEGANTQWTRLSNFNDEDFESEEDGAS